MSLQQVSNVTEQLMKHLITQAFVIRSLQVKFSLYMLKKVEILTHNEHNG